MQRARCASSMQIAWALGVVDFNSVAGAGVRAAGVLNTFHVLADRSAKLGRQIGCQIERA